MAESIAMQGKRVLITGATGGIGRVTAREVARLGAEVIIIGRSREKSEATVTEIKEKTGNQAVSYLLADLSLQAQVRRLADEVLAKYDRLDVLVNNAGALFTSKKETAEGHEMTFALNHLSYFTLTNLLMPLLEAAPQGRVVSVSSDAHQGTRQLDFNDLEYKTRRYNAFGAYSASKLMNVLFSYDLADRLRLGGTSVTSNALHPGFVRTNFGASNGGFFRIIPFIARFVGINEDQGAQTSVYLAGSPEVEGVTGKYFDKCKAVQSSSASYDETAQRELWRISAQMTGTGFKM